MSWRRSAPSLPLAGRVPSAQREAGGGLGRGARRLRPHPSSGSHGPPDDTLPARGRLSRARLTARALACAGLLVLAACQSTPQGFVLLHAGQEPLDVASNIADRVGACWFDRSSAFADYSYAPELSSRNRPRVLIVDKADPGGLPQLVIEVSRAGRGSDIKLFGPLMDGERASRIRRDVGFWAGGGRTCR